MGAKPPQDAMFVIGQRVKHESAGDTGTIQQYNQTYSPLSGKTYYVLLVLGDDGREWFANGSQVSRI